MAKNNSEEYHDFFLELPPTDYLTDIEIQDEHEAISDNTPRGLSDEQVSLLAVDLLNTVRWTDSSEISSEPPQKD